MQAQKYLQRTINRILVVLDEDRDRRNEVLTYALGLGRLCEASLLLVYPAEPSLPVTQGFPAQGPPVMLLSRTWENEREWARQMVDEALAQCWESRVEAEGRVVTGIGEALSLTNGASECDLVVVSRVKRRGLGLFQRDPAVQIVRGSPRPVVVVEWAGKANGRGKGAQRETRGE